MEKFLVWTQGGVRNAVAINKIIFIEEKNGYANLSVTELEEPIQTSLSFNDVIKCINAININSK